MSTTHTKFTPRALQERAGGAQKSFRSAPESPRAGPMGARGPPKEYSGALAVPKCARTHSLDGIPAQREVRSEAPKCVPKVAQRGPGATKGAQESSKRGLKGCLGPPRRSTVGSIVAPGPPKRYQGRGQKGAQKRVKSGLAPKWGKLNSNNYLLHFRHFAPLKDNHFGSLWCPKIDARTGSPNQRPNK